MRMLFMQAARVVLNWPVTNSTKGPDTEEQDQSLPPSKRSPRTAGRKKGTPNIMTRAERALPP